MHPFLEAYIVPFDNMKANPQGETIQAKTSTDPLNTVSKICGIFSNGDVLLASGMQPKGNSNCLYCLGSHLDNTDQ